MTNATDPTDSQSIERTPDPSESKLSTTQTTKLEKQIQNLVTAILRHHDDKCMADPLEILPLTALIQSEASRIAEEAKEDLLFDLDEIDNKPWRVFRQLAKIMPEYADIYRRYENFYAAGGGNEVMKLIEAHEASLTAPEGGKAR